MTLNGQDNRSQSFIVICEIKMFLFLLKQIIYVREASALIKATFSKREVLRCSLSNGSVFALSADMEVSNLRRVR